jgi:hypothetical protein
LPPGAYGGEIWIGEPSAAAFAGKGLLSIYYDEYRRDSFYIRSVPWRCVERDLQIQGRYSAERRDVPETILPSGVLRDKSSPSHEERLASRAAREKKA